MENADISKDGGAIIRELRMKKQLSLKAVAEKADVNYVFLSRLERGLEKASEELIRRLAVVLDYEGEINELVVRFGKVPKSIEKLLLDDPESVVELPAYFKSRRRKKTQTGGKND